MLDFAGLRPFATEVERRYLDAVEQHGGVRAAARALGVHNSTAGKAIERLTRRAEMRGYSPAHDMTHVVPESFVVRGVSTYYNREGKPTGQWVKSRLDDTAWLDRIKDLVTALSGDIEGAFAAPAPHPVVLGDYLTVYPLGDPHIGMYAWGEQAGEDFDLDIAERDLRGAMVRLVAASPASQTAIILNLGDFFHADNPLNMTMRSGNGLDVDSRWEKVMRVGANLMFWMVEHALEKHETVIVRNVQGNHDDTSAFALSLILEAYFRNEPRVQVDASPRPFWYHRFGKVLIGSTHGDKVKQADLPGIMAADRAEDWGQTRYRYFYTGHIHHRDVKEHFGVVCESFRTLAASDNYHHSHGYRSGRDMHAIVLHREWGEVERHRADILRIRSEQCPT